MKKNFSALIVFIFPLVFSGCSIFGSDPVTPETKAAVLRICDEYLRDLAGGLSGQAEAMIAWPEYGPQKGGLSRAEFESIVKSKKDIWSRSEHPLLGLDVKEVDIDEDAAEVVLQKPGKKEKIEIELSWVGRGWLVVNDNILEVGGAYRR